MTFLTTALEYAARGWSVFPLVSRDKRPTGLILPRVCAWPKQLDKAGNVIEKGAWEEYQYKPALESEIREWWRREPNANIAIATGPVSGFFVIDVDGPEGLSEWNQLASLHEPITTLTSITGSGGYHLLFQWVDGLDIGNKNISKKINVRGEGGYIAAPPSIHPNGNAYQWQDESASIALPPLWLLELLVNDKRGVVSPPLPPAPPFVSSSNGHSAYAAYANAALRDEINRLRGVQTNRNDALNATAFRLGPFVRDGHLDRSTVELELTDAAIVIGLDTDSNCGSNGIQATIASGLNSGIARSNRRFDTLTAPPALAMSANGHAEPASDAPATPQPKAKKDKPPTPTDDELAQRWLNAHPVTVTGMGDFRRYAAGMWPALTVEQIGLELTEILLAAKAEGIRPTAGRYSSVETMAQHMTGRHATKWDADPDLLVCKNGTLHIPTMQLRPHDPEDYQTSGVAFDYDERATAPTFLMVLNQAVPEAATFIQEFAGYALTTDTKFEICLWFTGPPGSGKSTLIEGLRAMLGSRCGLLGLAAIERSNFALSNVPGKTLLVSTEQPSGYMRATSTLNELISGETISVERKFKDAYEIVPRAKLAWAMNELPRVGDANNGLFRRVKIVRFPALSTAPNPAVKEQVKTEGAGILNWALAGLQRLRERGRFDIPACVDESVKQYKETNDVPALFVAECCQIGPDKQARASTLYNTYKTWCVDNGHKPQSSTSIAEDWRRLGFEHGRDRNGSLWTGVGVEFKPKSDVDIRF